MPSLTRTIEVDFDVHQRIEAARRSFDDPPNAVLRRLLRIDEDDVDGHSSTSPTVDAAPMDLNEAWTKRGVRLAGGTDLRVEYAEIVANGHVGGGRLVFNGSGYDSPSRAVMEVVRERRGDSVSINGWKHLYVREPIHGSWVSLDQLRDRQPKSAS